MHRQLWRTGARAQLGSRILFRRLRRLERTRLHSSRKKNKYQLHSMRTFQRPPTHLRSDQCLQILRGNAMRLESLMTTRARCSQFSCQTLHRPQPESIEICSKTWLAKVKVEMMTVRQRMKRETGHRKGSTRLSASQPSSMRTKRSGSEQRYALIGT